MKPFTRIYGFFDGVDLNRYITPNWIEIDMQQGTFQVGETVEGVMHLHFRMMRTTEQFHSSHLELLFLTINMEHSTIQLIVMIKTCMILKEMTFR